MNRTPLWATILMMGSLLWIACGADPSPAPQPVEETPAPAVEAVESAPELPANTIVIESDDLMKFDLTAFEVKAGEEITLTLKHVGKMAKELMGHNVVILNAGVVAKDFALAIPQNGGNLENEYLPESMADQVFAATSLIGGGEETTLTFVAPEAGEYAFLCTFPGHFITMSGIMTSV